MARQYLPLQGDEMAQLLRAKTSQGRFREPLNVVFGPGGSALYWEEGQSPPPEVDEILVMRGILQEQGSGI